ncbi:MAG: response regulator transcription factor [Flavobacteriales bacterium]|nr:response regulator transcription factor [Flavobacteriales bacterium]
MTTVTNDKQPRILLVEDDMNLGFVVQDTLKMEGFKVHLCKDGKEGLNQFNKEQYDLCLLDVMMPKKDGFSMAEDIRKTNQEVPIVFLTAKGMSEDKIAGFRAGGDDYITKPFSTEELVLRLRAILKRNPKFKDDPKEKHKLTIGKYQFDSGNYELRIGEARTKLTKKEADLLKLMAEHQGQVLERELIANMIWGDDSYFVGRSMDVFITKLRKYLSGDPGIAIVNVHGVGFRLEVN